MKRTLLLIIMLLVPCFSASLLGHETTIAINADNSATVTERYSLSLSEPERNLFDNISNTNVNSLTQWQTFIPQITTYVIGNVSNLRISTSQASGGQFGSEVKLEYTVPNFPTKTGIEGRYEDYAITGDKFKYYDANTSTFNIDISSDLTITLPSTIADSDILSVSPEPWFSSGKNMRWISGTRSNNFTVQYRKEIAISESFDITRLINTYFFQKPLYGGLITATVLLSIFYRKQIAGLITESFTPEEEIQLPKK